MNMKKQEEKLFREENLRGQLMFYEPDPNTRFRFYLWLDYTLDLINKIKEGDLVGIPNFASDPVSEIRYSILELTKILPYHYAMPTDLKGFPGFLMEAVKNAAIDWTAQHKESTEETTKIFCEAIPVNLEFAQSTSSENLFPELNIDKSMPMPGREIKLLASSFTQWILNYQIEPKKEETLTIGELVRDPQIEIFLRTEELVRTHFGIFGYTGAGKSNLVSTIASKLLGATKTGLNIVVVDLIGEYTGLLIDRLVETQDALVICIDRETLAEPVFEAINTSSPTITDKIAELHVETMVLPKTLKKISKTFIPSVKELLQGRKIRIYDEISGVQYVDDVVSEGNPWKARRKVGKPFQDIRNIVSSVFGSYYKKNIKITKELASELLTGLDGKLKDNEVYRNDFIDVINILKSIIYQEPLYCGITLQKIIDALNDEKSSLMILIAHRPDRLRQFVHNLGMSLFENRRKTGKISPLAGFIFDEADEFIPQDPDESQRLTLEVAGTLARRGRKFGLGLGIATQRIIYLNTSIMAQPHTYFISKLPRKSDRERLAEAFAISDTMFEQTFKFSKGDWLLVSHDATGLESVPFPIHAENAEERIINFFKQKGYLK